MLCSSVHAWFCSIIHWSSGKHCFTESCTLSKCLPTLWSNNNNKITFVNTTTNLIKKAVKSWEAKTSSGGRHKFFKTAWILSTDNKMAGFFFFFFEMALTSIFWGKNVFLTSLGLNNYSFWNLQFLKVSCRKKAGSVIHKSHNCYSWGRAEGWCVVWYSLNTCLSSVLKSQVLNS